MSDSLQPHRLYSLPGSSISGIFQARILEWVATSFSRRSSWPQDWTWVSCIVGRCFTVWATRELQSTIKTTTQLLMTSLVAQLVNNLSTVQETWLPFLGWEDPLEKEITTQSSILAWRIPLTEELGGLQSTGSHRVGHSWSDLAQTQECRNLTLETDVTPEDFFLWFWTVVA